MQTSVVKGFFGLLVLVVVSNVSLVGQETAFSASPSDSLKSYLRAYLSLDEKIAPDKTTRITTSTIKIANPRTELEVVYVTGDGWCGSGGCTMLILESNESSFRVLGRVTIVQLPIRLLHSVKHGHPDIGVFVQGGGILPGYEAVLSFDGKAYPGNPSVPPARKATAVRGRVIIANVEHSVSLYD